MSSITLKKGWQALQMQRVGPIVGRQLEIFVGSRFGVSDLSVAELPAEAARERIDPDAFDGLCVTMEGVEFAAARA
jgi:hypothetical protein